MNKDSAQRMADAEKEQQEVDRLFLDHQISLESVIRVLIRKGILHPEELVAEEQEKQERQRRQHAELVWSIAERKARESSHSRRGYRRPSSWPKRLMAKRRWSRRLGTFLFGWKWKKVSHRSHTEERAKAEL